MPFNLRAELHCHSNDNNFPNIYFPLFRDSTQTSSEIVDACVRRNIKILAITDHDSLIGYKNAKKYIKDNHLDILLIPACEVTAQEGHILAYNIHEEIPRKIPSRQVVDNIHSQGGIAVCAHPFMIHYHGKRVYDYPFDAIEGLNAAIPMPPNYKAISVSNELELPFIAGSDAHEKPAVGNAQTIFPDLVKTPEDFQKCLLSGKFSISFKHSSYLNMFTEHVIQAKNNLLKP